ncbi:hypothetical protein XELAEV_18038090mg [Xenopus laevis]|uniref:Secreted protein n=1 Tax=Xenopus laevis TaxID=8355 RepID=A0A974C5C9_XENLA|nr:hypothetical protein XELAEV_18038090mg [Xenopus laevis]
MLFRLFPSNWCVCVSCFLPGVLAVRGFKSYSFQDCFLANWGIWWMELSPSASYPHLIQIMAPQIQLYVYNVFLLQYEHHLGQ